MQTIRPRKISGEVKTWSYVPRQRENPNEHPPATNERGQHLRASLAIFNFPKRVFPGHSEAVAARRCQRREARREEEEKEEKKQWEKRKGTTKEKERRGKGGRAKTAASDSGKQQRQHDSRWLARHCSLPVLYFSASSSSFLAARARGRAHRGLYCVWARRFALLFCFARH